MVASLRGAHDIVRPRPKSGSHFVELRRRAVGELLRRQAFAVRRPLHFLAMFIHSGNEQHFSAVKPLQAGDRIGGDTLIGMADMRRAISVGYRGRDVEGGAGTHQSAISKLRAKPLYYGL